MLGHILILLAAISLGWSQVQPLPFELQRPDRSYKLPQELLEISALTDVDEHTIACLHDEAAQLYFMDLRSGQVVRGSQFADPGDMEGLTRVGDEYFALRSDGLVYRLGLNEDEVVVRDTFTLRIPNRNIEGLGWDERNGVILISPKDIPKGKPEVRDKRKIFCYDPQSRRMCDRPALTLSLRQVVDQARRLGMEIPTKTTDKGRVVPALKMRFSSVAIDPFTDHFYLLSAADRVLLVVDREGGLVALEVLDEKLFAKPEGITFLPSGDMLISNEGKGSPPNVHRFGRKKH